ncbi:SCP2 sterol-binding domain-containing protein [Curtanaerobium respiraculi]|uniref:SCP2 sterol-binding domain-containing protein n=1 Tax=Curtanaerobium respiraculi TaxID=2949669 RepID=UPI0024B33E7E|nr:SCP2 sterol-binding domain-containing protein [Curtanaerobium respiraculi]
MADASWSVSADGIESLPPAVSFTRQMAALYNPAAWEKDIVLQMDYTDEGLSVQIILERDGQRVITEDFLPCTTRIRTPLSTWRSIARGEISGTQAMMDHLYTVEGDFDTMLRWDDLFGTEGASTGADGGAHAPKSPGDRRSNMGVMLFPWIACFVAVPIDAWIGGIASILAAAMTPLLLLKWKPTVYEYATIPSVAAIGLASLLGAPPRIVVPASYLAFGIMWFSSAFMKIPLSAHYSMSGYGFEKAFSNPLFVSTNRILSCCWGVLYLLTPIWTYILMGTPLAVYVGLINSALPALLGVFTAWFQKWYPAHYVRG